MKNNAIVSRIGLLGNALQRHMVCNNTAAYEDILRDIHLRKDIWMTEQGSYVNWWQEREGCSLTIYAGNDLLRVMVSHPHAVIEDYPGRFLDSGEVACPQNTYDGEVWITIDSQMTNKDALIEILRREGMLNFQIGDKGDFFLSRAEVEPILERVQGTLHKKKGRFDDQDIEAIKQIVIDKLARYHLPLIRIWYHPRVDGIVPKAAFSVRHDVDRAISNLQEIRHLEKKYGLDSTLYMRPFGPFYDSEDIKKLVSMPWCSEIALHGEFVTNSKRFGDEFEAAQAEKDGLESMAGCRVVGVGMHGGEGTNNRTKNTADALERAGLIYDTTPRPGQYYFPFRKYSNGAFGASYNLPHALSDINIPANRDYSSELYERVRATMDMIYQKSGVFVLMMHPVYFGFLHYAVRPKSIALIAKFLLSRIEGKAKVHAKRT